MNYGQSVPLRLTITNDGHKGVHFLIWGTPFEGWFAPFVTVRREDVQLAYRGPSVKRADPGREEYVRIPAGRRRSATVDLAEAFDLRERGRYRVEANIVLHDVFADGETAPPRPRAAHRQQPLDCGPLEFRVDGRR